MRKLGVVLLSGMMLSTGALADDNGPDTAPIFYIARLDKTYVDRLDKAIGDAQAAFRGGDDLPPFDAQAVVAANAERAAAFSQCDLQRASSTATAWVECRLAASKAFVVAEKLQDMGVFDAYAEVVRAAAADGDSGRLGFNEVTAVYNALLTEFYARIDKDYAAYRKRVDLINKPISDLYVARFEKLYADAQATHGPYTDAAPPYDAAATAQAFKDRSHAHVACGVRRAELKTLSAMLECNLDSNKIFYATIKFRDQDLIDAYDTAMREAAADGDAGKITLAQTLSATAAIEAKLSQIQDSERAPWPDLAPKPPPKS